MLVSNGVGEATAYALFYLQDRGPAMIAPQARVYEGMIVGEHTATTTSSSTSRRARSCPTCAAGKDENLILTPPMRLTLEKAMSYIADDELVEVTPSRSGCASGGSTPTSARSRSGEEAEREASLA